MTLPKITDRTDLKGKRVMVRAGLNVPLKDGVVANAFRLKKATETILWLKSQEAKILIVAHIGREKTDTLKPVFEVLSKDIPMQFVEDYFSAETNAKIEGLRDGDILMFENVRTLPGETDNDPELAKKLAALADIYVCDAFADIHRAHASTVGVPSRIPAYAGFLVAREVEELTRALNPESPSLFILGGAKFETKEPILRACLPLYDEIFVGGALAHDFFKARGLSIGHSLCSDDAKGLEDIKNHPKILLPVDVTVKNARGVEVKTPDEVDDDDTIMDAGPETIAALVQKINTAKHILWNGPVGNYEAGFAAHTEELAKAVAKAEGISIVGGGDTVASIDSLGIESEFTFVSTGGGAMLDFLADGSLPGVDAILNSPR